MALEIEGLKLDALTADPGSPADGQVWLNTTDGVVRARIGGVTKSLVAPTADEATATGDTTTTSATDVLADSMTLTPAAGSYLVWFTGSVGNSQTNSTLEMSIYAGGAQNAASERRVTRGGAPADVTVPFTCVAKVTVNGSQAIEGRWRVSGGTGTMHERSLSILQVA